MRIFQQLLPGTAQRDFAVFQYITAIGDFKRMKDILLD